MSKYGSGLHYSLISNHLSLALDPLQIKGCQLKNLNFFQTHIAQVLFKQQSRFASHFIHNKIFNPNWY